ncbi:hypothetical protein [Aureimonas frigidaquae]|uniref:hypothetical protein n=1 Tax=Aureimonas frigidaquae TaxID=424757 RepID=UPI000784E6C6|nr:hypothetical protein [Aureimonas frigidaquae]
MFDFKKITSGLGLARSGAGAKVGQPSQHHRPVPDANYILSDGLNAYDIGNGSSARMEPIAGRRYRILRRRMVDGHEVVEEVSQAAVLRTSTAADSDLILQLDGKTRITFQKFYAVCADDMCGIELPNSAGGRVVINATTPVQQAYTHGGGLVYSFGDPDTVLALTDSFSHWFGSSPIAHNVAEVASSASTMSSKLPLALLGIAAAGGGAAAFAGGGGGGGGGGGVVPATEMVTIRGTVVAGPIIVDRILKVSFYKVDGTPLVENVLVLRDGSFSASFVKGYSGVIVAKLVDPDDQVDYRDEASNGYRDTSRPASASWSCKAPEAAPS